MQAFADGYGFSIDDELVQAVFVSQREGMQRIIDLADRGHPRYRQMVEDGKLERERLAVLGGELRRDRFWVAAAP